MLDSELKNEKYSFLITGGAGFIGSNLAISLLKYGQRVIVIDNFLTGRKENLIDIQNYNESAHISKDNFNFINGDIRDFDVCKDACQNVDFVLHQAALGSVPRSIEDPLSSYEVNVIGTLNVLLAARDAGVKRLVYASSSSVYGNALQLPKVEGEEGTLLSPYAVTKLVDEMMANNFRLVYDLDVIGLRYFNVFGPRQDPFSQYAAVIPIWIRHLLTDERPTIYGDGETSRDFTYIENVIQANIKSCFADESAIGQVFNIAFGKRETLNYLYREISSFLHKDIKPIHAPERKGDIRHSLADITKAQTLLKYDPQIDLSEGLRLSKDWYIENL